jgi:hypothetical protein
MQGVQDGVRALYDPETDEPILSRYERRKRHIKLVGVRYSDERIGRNTLVSVDGGPPVKFKRTGAYRAGRVARSLSVLPPE